MDNIVVRDWHGANPSLTEITGLILSFHMERKCQRGRLSQSNHMYLAAVMYISGELSIIGWLVLTFV